jgi:hypothetical protein
MADNRCDYCGKYEMLPFKCKYCGGTFCSGHRLPEYHDCAGLRIMKQGGWQPPVPGRKPAAAAQRKRRPWIKLPAQGYYSYMIIAICAVAFFMQMALPEWFTNALVLKSQSLLAQPWTLFTYMFLHASPIHIFFNMLMLFFFGPLLERQIGSGRFLGVYAASGVLAGLAQVLLFGGAVIGASAAIFGVMGTLAMLMPDLRIYFYFVPMKLIFAILIFAAIDILFMGSGDQVAHLAHLVGLAFGLIFGYVLKKNKGTLQAYRPV